MAGSLFRCSSSVLLLIVVLVPVPCADAGSYHSDDLTSWGGGWRAIRLATSGNATAEKAAEFSKSALHSLQEMSDNDKTKQAKIGEASIVTTDTFISAPTIMLPKWAKWCQVRPCDGSAPFYMATHASNDIVSNSVCAHGRWEHCSAQHFAGRQAKAGKAPVAVDIGSNIGYYTLLLANAGWQVVAVEPLPLNTQLLEASLKANPSFANRVHLHKVGLSAQAGDQCGVVSQNQNVGDGNTACFDTTAKLKAWLAKYKNSSPTDPLAYQVRGSFTMSTLDTVILHEPLLASSANGGIDFLKIDVEGYEGQVLQGGGTLLSKHKPLKIFSEVWKSMQKTTPMKYLNEFATAGYTVSVDEGKASDRLATFSCAKSKIHLSQAMVDSWFSKGGIINVQMCLDAHAASSLAVVPPHPSAAPSKAKHAGKPAEVKSHLKSLRREFQEAQMSSQQLQVKSRGLVHRHPRR